jgi:hypothetical protein
VKGIIMPKFYLLGDLEQVDEQINMLISNGVIGCNESEIDLPTDEKGYHYFKNKLQFRSALKCIWDNKYPGWWCYHKEMIDWKVCSEQEFESVYYTGLNEEEHEIEAAYYASSYDGKHEKVLQLTSAG